VKLGQFNPTPAGLGLYNDRIRRVAT